MTPVSPNWNSEPLGPVSAAAVAELREEARQHGVLVWLDKDATYTALVDRLIAEPEAFPFPVLAYRGSFLELMLALDGTEDGVTMQPLVLHMPGFNEDDITQTPVLELYRAGRRYRQALPTLVKQAAHGVVTPAEIEAALAEGLPGLAAADAWLAAHMRGDDSGDAVELPVLSVAQLFDDLVAGGPVAKGLRDTAMCRTVLRYLERILGLDHAWRADVAEGNLQDADELRLLLSSWALCVEFVADLKRAPKDAFLQPLAQLPKAAVTESRRLAEHIRSAHPALYERDAADIEAGLQIEAREATAADLGRIDTFRFEDHKVFEAALAALRDEQWERAAALASARTEARSFWVRRDAGRRTGWQLVALAAALGGACARHAGLLDGVRSLDDAAERYAGAGYEVDGAHRRLEQARELLLQARTEDFASLRDRLNALRRIYRRWADEQAVAFNALCQERGFLPDAALQQRTLFEEVVRAAAGETAPVAYFLVDGLRYELARQLVDLIGAETGARLELRHRFAELPTVTEVGMNVLAPVTRGGRLAVDLDGGRILGFRSGQTRVSTPAARQKAMHERVGGETCPWLPLEDLLERDVRSIRQAISRARLLVVHAIGIDKAGEQGVGLRCFEDELQRLRAAWLRLRDAGVRSFVLTADHGFLLQDETTRDPLSHGKKTDPARRHVIERHAADHVGEVRVPTTELAYDCDAVQLIFPERSQPFDTGDRKKAFLHGGNSLQERLIPVMTAHYRHAKGEAAQRYLLAARAEVAVMGNHRISATLTHDSYHGLDFGGSGTVELRLEARDADAVSVELVDAPGARIAAGVVVASVGVPFELLFRLSGLGGAPARAAVRLVAALDTDEVVPVELERRFTVTVAAGAAMPTEPALPHDGGSWLRALPEGAVRSVFEHIERFGAINEADATSMLGGARAFRRFSRRFEEHAALAPFEIRIDTASGQKRYVREGG